MNNKLKISIFLFVLLFIFDQFVKYGFANWGWDVDGPYMSLKLAYNYGVAFSMFEFLQGALKYIQLAIIAGATIYLLKNKDVFYEYWFAATLLYVGALSNILDRFTYGAVVDYFYWHYGFEFAIFNLSDVMIDFAVVIILYKQFFGKKSV